MVADRQRRSRDYFASSLTAGDFNGDGCADLAIGVIGEDVPNGVDNAGAVHVLYGSAAIGLSTSFDQFWHQGHPGVPDDPEPSDWFGGALASGDFNADGYHDLAIGVPGEDVVTDGSAIADAGAVHVICPRPILDTDRHPVSSTAMSLAASGIRR